MRRKNGHPPGRSAWGIFGLPRIITDLNALRRFLKLVDSPYNGLTILHRLARRE